MRLMRQTEHEYEPHVPDWVEWQSPEYVGTLKNGQILGYHCRNGEIARLKRALGRFHGPPAPADR